MHDNANFSRMKISSIWGKFTIKYFIGVHKINVLIFFPVRSTSFLHLQCTRMAAFVQFGKAMASCRQFENLRNADNN